MKNDTLRSWVPLAFGFFAVTTFAALSFWVTTAWQQNEQEVRLANAVMSSPEARAALNIGEAASPASAPGQSH